jgi:hypothetical protein
MGLAYVPLTFPTVTVRTNMAPVLASNSEVDRLWSAYKEATVTDKIPPYNSDLGGANIAPLLRALETKTGYTRMKIAAWLNALQKAVREQSWGWRWLDPAGAMAAEKDAYSLNPVESLKKAAKDLGQAAGDLVKPSLDPVTNLVKYGALLVVGGAVIYGIYHGTKIFKKRRKKGG